ncbi:hypothetical protein FCV25MIE_28484 [Fagus crenata]
MGLCCGSLRWCCDREGFVSGFGLDFTMYMVGIIDWKAAMKSMRGGGDQSHQGSLDPLPLHTSDLNQGVSHRRSYMLSELEGYDAV